MSSKQALEKQSLFEGIKTWKVMTSLPLLTVCQVPGLSKSSKNIVLSFKIEGTIAI